MSSTLYGCRAISANGETTGHWLVYSKRFKTREHIPHSVAVFRTEAEAEAWIVQHTPGAVERETIYNKFGGNPISWAI